VISIAVLGASGRMGRSVVARVLDAPDLELVAAIGRSGSPSLGLDAGLLAGRGVCGVAITAIEAGLGDADVVVDFALPAGTLAALPHLGGRALVSGTTGLDADGLERLAGHALRGPLLHAANFSTGVNVLLALVRSAAAALSDFDVEVVEAHHRGKADAPSGTALGLARSAAEARGLDLEAVRQDGRVGRTGSRPPEQIGLHALRAGGVVGHHEVWLAGPDERIVLTHAAGSREAFSAGALRAARWIVGRPAGAYSMADVLGLPASGAR
jgi:4-hydroxy-tetrahydrodipicolinate reductase